VKYKSSVITSFQDIDPKPLSQLTERWTDGQTDISQIISPLFFGRGHINLLFLCDIKSVTTNHQNKQVKRATTEGRKNTNFIFFSNLK